MVAYLKSLSVLVSKRRRWLLLRVLGVAVFAAVSAYLQFRFWNSQHGVGVSVAKEWRAVSKTDNPLELETFIANHPEAKEAEFAKRRLPEIMPAWLTNLDRQAWAAYDQKDHKRALDLFMLMHEHGSRDALGSLCFMHVYARGMPFNAEEKKLV